MAMKFRDLSADEVQSLLGHLTPEQWNVLAELTDQAQFPGRAIEDAYEIRSFLGGLLRHPAVQLHFEQQKQEALARQQGKQGLQVHEGGLSPAPGDTPKKAGAKKKAKRRRKKS